MSGNQRLAAQAVSGAFWAYSSFATGKALVFVSTIILARLLAPEHFGLLAICLIAIQYFDILNLAGVAGALIQRRDKIEEAANAAFVMAIISGTMLYAVAWMIAPALEAFFRENGVTELFRVIALVIPLSSLGIVPSALLQRGMRFKTKFVPDLGRGVAKGSVSIVLAWQGFGVWSLVYGQIAGELIATVVLLALAGWRPSRRYDRAVTRQVARFGGHIVSVGVAGAIVQNVDYLLVGRMLGVTALGYYTIAFRIPELVIRNTNFVIARVAFPLLSQVQADMPRMRDAYRGMLKYVSLFAFPAGVGLALIADPFIRTFYTERWVDAIPVMQLVAIALAISAVGHLPGIIYKAANRPEILNQLSLLKLGLTVAALLVAVQWGIVGVAAGQVALAVAFVILDVAVVSRVLGFAARSTLSAAAPALIATVAMAAVAGSASLALRPHGVAGIVFLVALGMSAYAGTLMLVSRETVTQAGAVLRSVRARV